MNPYNISKNFKSVAPQRTVKARFVKGREAVYFTLDKLCAVRIFATDIKFYVVRVTHRNKTNMKYTYIIIIIRSNFENNNFPIMKLLFSLYLGNKIIFCL